MVSTLLSIFWRAPPSSAWDDVAWTSSLAAAFRFTRAIAQLEVGDHGTMPGRPLAIDVEPQCLDVLLPHIVEKLDVATRHLRRSELHKGFVYLRGWLPVPI